MEGSYLSAEVQLAYSTASADRVVGGCLVFNGISTLVGDLMPNPVFVINM